MTKLLAALAAAATLSFAPAPAHAITAGPAMGVQHGLADTSMVEQVRRVCRLDRATNRQVCWTDRTQPPTVCHWVRDRNGNLVRDCY